METQNPSKPAWFQQWLPFPFVESGVDTVAYPEGISEREGKRSRESDGWTDDGLDLSVAAAAPFCMYNDRAGKLRVRCALPDLCRLSIFPLVGYIGLA